MGFRRLAGWALPAAVSVPPMYHASSNLVVSGSVARGAPAAQGRRGLFQREALPDHPLVVVLATGRVRQWRCGLRWPTLALRLLVVAAPSASPSHRWLPGHVDAGGHPRRRDGPRRRAVHGKLRISAQLLEAPRAQLGILGGQRRRSEQLGTSPRVRENSPPCLLALLHEPSLLSHLNRAVRHFSRFVSDRFSPIARRACWWA